MPGFLQRLQKERERQKRKEALVAYELAKKIKTLQARLGKKVAEGTDTEIYLDDYKDLENIYGRSGLCFKVFFRSKSIWGNGPERSTSTIEESTIAQNLLAIKGYCPRVFDLVEVEGKTTQITEYLTGFKKKPYIEDSRMYFYPDDVARDHNYIDGKLIDLQGTRLKDYSGYKNLVLSELIKRNSAHGHSDKLYQSTEYHEGLRNTEERLKQYNFKDFEGKYVLDIGCSNGMMCRAASDAGAKRVVGLEWPDMAEMAQELAILDGYYNLDFYGVDIKHLKKEELQALTGIEKFDVHLFLAMEVHVGWPEWVKNCKTLYYEGHGRKRPYQVYHYN